MTYSFIATKEPSVFTLLLLAVLSASAAGQKPPHSGLWTLDTERFSFKVDIIRPPKLHYVGTVNVNIVGEFKILGCSG